MTFTPVTLNGAQGAKELDDVVALTRHDKSFGCQPVIRLTRISSVLSKPRKLYDLADGAQPGTAIFLPSGEFLGMAVSMGGGEGLMAMGGMEMLVLPAADVAKLAAQAKEAAAKKAEKTEKAEKSDKADKAK